MKSTERPNEDGKRKKVLWDRLFSGLRADVFSGKLDGVLQATVKSQPPDEVQKAEPVSPATPKAREEKTNNQDAERSRPWTTYEERVQNTVPDHVFERLVHLCKHIRPGTKASDLDALVDLSDGLLTAERLNSPKVWAPNQVPCQLKVATEGDKAGTVVKVTFDARHHDPENVQGYGSVEALLNAWPGASRAFRSSVEAGQEIEKVDLPTGSSDIVARIHFRSGKFEKTEYGYGTALKKVDTILADFDREKLEEKKLKQARVGAYASLPLEEKVAGLRAKFNEKPAPFGSNERLRDWANGYSAWNESPNRWASFANWLITESTPDDRHCLVTGVNWDHGPEIFRWIICQPDTDVATAAMVLWQGGVGYHITESAKAEAAYANGLQLELYDLLLETADRIRDGFYKPSPGHKAIGFEPPYKVDLDRRDPAVRAAEDRLLPEVARGVIAGRSRSEFRSAVPEQYYNLLN